MLGRNSGIVIMAPPSDSGEARAAIATLLSAVKPNKQKVRGRAGGRAGWGGACTRRHPTVMQCKLGTCVCGRPMLLPGPPQQPSACAMPAHLVPPSHDHL